MKNEIRVLGSRVIVGEYLEHITSYLPVGKRVIVITEECIIMHYRRYFDRYNIIEIEGGEEHKTLTAISRIVTQLMESGADRDSFLLGVGGGIVCDMTGFAASVYMRGCRFGFVPTTLLAQVDASVGGKNGVNHEGYKNMLGVFRQPEFVLCIPEVFRTLPQREFAAGFAEIVKVAMLADSGLFQYLERHAEAVLERDAEVLEQLIYRAVKIKAAIVERDERERGERRLLNLGHTFAHAIEKNVSMMHGEAVSIGLCMAACFSRQLGEMSEAEVHRIERLLERLTLPTSLDIPRFKLIRAMKRDKKKEGEFIHWVIPLRIGTCEVRQMSLEQPRHVALIGFMGVGKTTVGGLLAHRLGWLLADTDRMVEQQYGESIPVMMEERGEAYFRSREASVVRDLLEDDGVSVIACGGGVVLDAESRRLLKEKSVTVWLRADPGDCVNRIEVGSRPLLAKHADPRKAANEIFESRKGYYAETACTEISCEGRDVNDICDLIYEEIIKSW